MHSLFGIVSKPVLLNMGILPARALVNTIAGGPYISIGGENPGSYDSYVEVVPATPLATIIPFRRADPIVPDRTVVQSGRGDSSKLALPNIARTLFPTRYEYEMPANKAKRLRTQWSIKTLIFATDEWVRGMASIERNDPLIGVDNRVALIMDDLIVLSNEKDVRRAMLRLSRASYASGTAFRYLAEFVRRGCGEARGAMLMMEEDSLYLMIAQYDHTYGIAFAMGELYDIAVARTVIARIDEEERVMGLERERRMMRADQKLAAYQHYRPLRESERTGAQVITSIF